MQHIYNEILTLTYHVWVGINTKTIILKLKLKINNNKECYFV